MNDGLNCGVFLLSIDVELGSNPTMLQSSREAVSRLLELMERYNIRGTWAVIGNTLVERNQNDRFSREYRELVHQVLSCKVTQEIGCHTYSHIRVGAPSCTRERFTSELDACLQVAKKIGVALKSFVYPWNSVGHTDCLPEHGFLSYRGESPVWYAGLPVSLRRLSHLLDHWLFIPPPVVTAIYEKRIWNLPASYYYVSGAGWGKMIPLFLRTNKAKKGFLLAARERRIFHMWFHPFDLAYKTNDWLKGLESIFSEVVHYRNSGLLDNPTMGELAQRLQLQQEHELIEP